MGITSHAHEVVFVYCNNTSALAYTKHPKYDAKSKHIDARYHFLRNKVITGEVVLLKHISTINTLVDPTTKHIIRKYFLTRVKNMGLRRV